MGNKVQMVRFTMYYTFQGAAAFDNSVIRDEDYSISNSVQEKVATNSYKAKESRCRFKKYTSNGGIIVNLIDYNNEKGIVFKSDFNKENKFNEKETIILFIKEEKKYQLNRHKSFCVLNLKIELVRFRICVYLVFSLHYIYPSAFSDYLLIIS